MGSFREIEREDFSECFSFRGIVAESDNDLYEVKRSLIRLLIPGKSFYWILAVLSLGS